MNVLLIGSGGREHSLALKISESPLLDRLYTLPGNPGTKMLGNNIQLELTNYNSVAEFCRMMYIELIVIGPEQPIVDGLGEFLRNEGFNVFAPDSKAAEIEAHKSFAKYIMKKYNIPTASYIEFTHKMYEHAKDYLLEKKYPCVIKADGLAAGKGVLICSNPEEANAAVEDLFVKKVFGKSGEKIIIEEFLDGEEASILAITDGKNFICLPSSQDHKRIGENDTGKNTGGMGAYSPAPLIDEKLLEEIETKIIKPTLDALNNEGKKFVGCLYAGLMITKSGPKVVEFNCRFGDPETQAVLPLLEGDFLKLLYSAADGNLDLSAVKYSGGSAVCVVAASGGYPDKYEKGFEITGLNNSDPEILIFHAGTKEEDGKIVTNGGRVLGVTSVLKENNLSYAKQKAYEAINKINFEGMYYRKDIADKALTQNEDLDV